jgi:cell division topological specificity factor
MIEFFKKLFNPEASSTTARERLRLVLLSDHLSLAPDVVEALRTDLIAVISKYVEVDEANCDVSFEQQDSAVAMLANIPILSMRSRPMPPPAPPSPPAPPASAGPVSSAPAGLGPATASAASGEAALPDAPVTPAPRKRRRRRRPSTNAAPAPG